MSNSIPISLITRTSAASCESVQRCNRSVPICQNVPVANGNTDLEDNSLLSLLLAHCSEKMESTIKKISLNGLNFIIQTIYPILVPTSTTGARQAGNLFSLSDWLHQPHRLALDLDACFAIVVPLRNIGAGYRYRDNDNGCVHKSVVHPQMTLR